MSGEALNNTQFSWSELTVMDDCVRAVTRLLPVRYPLQLGQLQFHCGKPPPAAEPRTCIFKREYFFERCDKKSQAPAGATPTGELRSAIGDVHRYFKAKTHIGSCWFFPFHTVTPEC